MESIDKYRTSVSPILLKIEQKESLNLDLDYNIILRSSQGIALEMKIRIWLDQLFWNLNF